MDTRQQLQDQISLAMYGVEQPVADMQTATGIKDKIAQHWINILIVRSREMKSSQPGRAIEDIVLELRAWYESQPGDKINPLLSVSGVWTICCSLIG